ncbi:dienelactone hydrolase family protein [Stigmatella aurantiaca]|uniref:Dienelactone hydrolase n=1 Tax=Stigmatella aurantiaca (strain DW4/3-1) TaxID=378806 RepID=Q08Q40_STIAD|nr:dienelactone hydrolase family protein [Stigmatella aurantiaca]ADO73623.1 Dienelactone hydrolase [Stigmatella aurantiaca DW4/3-1]EAU62592.1 dienelactone hydrolase [Stigmatella aurantiaca DW4/3-1]
MTRILGVMVGLLALTASAKPVQKPVKYELDGTKFEGVLVYDDAVKGPRPGLLMVPNWLGINEATLKQAVHAAGKQYIVFVADMYGESLRPKDQQEAGKAAGAVKGDRPLMRARVNKGLEILRAEGKAVKLDEKKVGAIGFCFGGTSVLELARSGANVAGVVSFHGGLDAPTPASEKGITAKVLALHGADDPFVPPAEVKGFEDEMRKAKADWELVSYGGAVHSFSEPEANAPGQAQYNAKVAKRAFQSMNNFFAEVFGS